VVAGETTMNDDEKILELEKRIKELERRLVYHWHTCMGSVVDAKGAAMWFDSLGEWHK
jgi:hypothetical protein